MHQRRKQVKGWGGGGGGWGGGGGYADSLDHEQLHRHLVNNCFIHASFLLTVQTRWMIRKARIVISGELKI